MNVSISTVLTSARKAVSSLSLLLLLLCATTASNTMAQCNPNVALTHTGPACAGTDTLILTGTDSVVQITWYTGNTIVSSGTDTAYIPTAAGTYYAIVNAGNCADTTAPATVSPVVTPAITISALSDSICRGGSVAFTAAISNGGGNPVYQWLKNGALAGSGATYTDSLATNRDSIVAILISDAACRTKDTAVSAPVRLTIFALPSAAVQVTGSLHRCLGDSVKLTAAAGNTYRWNTGDTSRSIYAHLQGAYHVTVTSSHHCTAVSADDTLFLSFPVQPSVSISGNIGDTICLNTQVTFHATSVNGGSNPQYQWKRNGANVGNTATYIGTVLLNGDVIACVLTSNAGCVSPRRDTSDAITMTVHSLPVPAITGDSSVCTGAYGLLTAAPAGQSYQWSNNAVAATISVAAGTYTLTVTDVNNCTAASVPFVIASLSSSVGALITQVGDSLYTAGSSQFYQWYYNGSIISGAIGPVAPISGSGFYQVSTIDSHGCRASSAVDTVLLTSIGDMTQLSGMRVYPNPTTGSFSMSWPDAIPRDIRIIDITGAIVIEDRNITALSKQFNLGTASSGIYYVQITQGNVTKTVKLSIVK